MARWLSIYEDAINSSVLVKYFDGEKEHFAQFPVTIGKEHIDFFTNCAFALDDLLINVDENVGFNGKVVCIESKYMDFKVGKIYKFECGKTISERGHEYPKGRYITNDVKDLNEIGLKFIEIVE